MWFDWKLCLNSGRERNFNFPSLSFHLLQSAQYLRKGNVFRSVCQEFYPRGIVHPPDRHPPGQTYAPLLGRHPPSWADTPQEDSPPRRPLQRTVRILLERILVFDIIFSSSIYSCTSPSKQEWIPVGCVPPASVAHPKANAKETRFPFGSGGLNFLAQESIRVGCVPPAFLVPEEGVPTQGGVCLFWGVGRPHLPRTIPSPRTTSPKDHIPLRTTPLKDHTPKGPHPPKDHNPSHKDHTF